METFIMETFIKDGNFHLRGKLSQRWKLSQAQLDNVLRDPSLLDPYQYIQTVLNLRGVTNHDANDYEDHDSNYNTGNDDSTNDITLSV